METGFAAETEQWSLFFSAAAGVAATLIGLLFVALALNPAIMRDGGPAGLRVWSGQTFHSFLMVLVLSMIAVIPATDGTTYAIALSIVGVTGLIAVNRAMSSARRDPDPEWRLTHAVWRFFSPLLAYLFCLWGRLPGLARKSGCPELDGARHLPAGDERRRQLLGSAQGPRHPEAGQPRAVS